jgi:hypothetical protein
MKTGKTAIPILAVLMLFSACINTSRPQAAHSLITGRRRRDHGSQL